jgi:hypothetical protein
MTALGVTRSSQGRIPGDACAFGPARRRLPGTTPPGQPAEETPREINAARHLTAVRVSARRPRRLGARWVGIRPDGAPHRWTWRPMHRCGRRGHRDVGLVQNQVPHPDLAKRCLGGQTKLMVLTMRAPLNGCSSARKQLGLLYPSPQERQSRFEVGTLQ